jgi:hypothetical protein
MYLSLTLWLVTITNLDQQNPRTLDEQECLKFLSKLTATDSPCYGNTNSDSRGGTWQVESDAYFIAKPAKKVVHSKVIPTRFL